MVVALNDALYNSENCVENVFIFNFTMPERTELN